MSSIFDAHQPYIIMETELKNLLKKYQTLINMRTLESMSDLPRTKLSHFLAGRRCLSKYEIINVLSSLKKFLADYVSCSNSIGAIIYKKNKSN